MGPCLPKATLPAERHPALATQLGAPASSVLTRARAEPHQVFPLCHPLRLLPRSCGVAHG